MSLVSDSQRCFPCLWQTVTSQSKQLSCRNSFWMKDGMRVAIQALTTGTKCFIHNGSQYPGVIFLMLFAARTSYSCLKIYHLVCSVRVILPITAFWSLLHRIWNAILTYRAKIGPPHLKNFEKTDFFLKRKITLRSSCATPVAKFWCQQVSWRKEVLILLFESVGNGSDFKKKRNCRENLQYQRCCRS